MLGKVNNREKKHISDGKTCGDKIIHLFMLIENVLYASVMVKMVKRSMTVVKTHTLTNLC